MAEKHSAADQLQRILHLIPRAARAKEGLPIAELARELEVDESTLLRDIETVIAREYYHPAGSVIDVSVFVDAERVFVRGAVFERSIRFTPREALALALGLRVLAAEKPSERADLLECAATLEAALSRESVEALADSFAIESEPDAVRAVLEECVRERCAASIVYMKPGEASEAERTVHPYAVVCGGVSWYMIGHCTRSDDVRVFRIDRIATAKKGDAEFAVPAGFDASPYLEHGFVYRAVEEVAARVRYSPRIARWMKEKGPHTEMADGSVEVELSIADPQWLVRHVLEHAPDADVVEPRELRELVGEVAQAMTGSR